MKREPKRGASFAARTTMKSFARRLKALREARKITQKDLAEMLDVQVTLVSRYERGLTVPSSSTVVHLARIFQVSTDELLTGSTKGGEPPTIRHATLFDRFCRIDEEIEDRKDLDAVIIFLDAFLARKQIQRMAASA